MGHVDPKATSNKLAIHEKTCYGNQHTYIPFAFGIVDFLVLDIVDILKRGQTFMHNNIVSPRSICVVFKRINFAIIIELVVQLIVGLTFVLV